jgi:hypothetical protein
MMPSLKARFVGFLLRTTGYYRRRTVCAQHREGTRGGRSQTDSQSTGKRSNQL